MKLSKIVCIKKTGILEDLDWSNLKSSLPDSDLDFRDINLIFGWNGSGKTTLSRLLRNFEIGEICSKLQRYLSSEYTFLLEDGSKLTQLDISDKRDIRVFNIDFIKENIFKDPETDGKGVSPIFYLGKEEIELTKERKEKEAKDIDLKKNINESAENKRKLDSQASGAARDIKNALLGIQEYKNYDKDKFIATYTKLYISIQKGEIALPGLKLEQSNFDSKLTAIKNSDMLASWVHEIKSAAENLSGSFLDEINALLCKTVTLQQSIEELSDYGLSQWVQQGLKIHETRSSTKCEFCGQPLPEARLKALEAHFNRDFTELNNAVSSKIKELEEWQIKNVDKILSAEVKGMAERINSAIQLVLASLLDKQKNLLLAKELSASTVSDVLVQSTQVLTEASEFKSSTFKIARSLEESLVADRFESYKDKMALEEVFKADALRLKTEIDELKKKIEAGEKSTKDFKLPAKDINSDLEVFLGHKELTFEDVTDEFGEVSYQIQRSGQIAYNLSEGEKTAISLIYFLRRLNDGFDFEHGIVYIDDPISSMDSQFLYSAYAFIISALEKTPDELRIAQFFLSTHNYDFLNLFKRKYRSKIIHKKCGLYMFKLNIDASGNRVSNLYPLDPLLAKFDSDYQYLYSMLVEFEKSDENTRSNLTMIYPYPNIARRVLETFLSFKFPSKTDYKAKINAPLNIPTEMREAVYHFTNAESHGTLREAQGFSSEIIAPSAQEHLLSVLRFMRLVDLDHCSAMDSQ